MDSFLVFHDFNKFLPDFCSVWTLGSARRSTTWLCAPTTRRRRRPRTTSTTWTPTSILSRSLMTATEGLNYRRSGWRKRRRNCQLRWANHTNFSATFVWGFLLTIDSFVHLDWERLWAGEVFAFQTWFTKCANNVPVRPIDWTGTFFPALTLRLCFTLYIALIWYQIGTRGKLSICRIQWAKIH